MGITISKISVKNLGPIKNFSAGFGIFNLIYSKNERGKTFLTEFIIRCLFKNISRWSYLREGGRGKVTITGLEKQPVDFTLHSREKMEDYWESSEKGLPFSMPKLLIARGGEAGIEDGEGVSKFLIKEVLSGINILDKIDSDSNISKTVKKAEIINNQLIISRTGEGKNYNDAREELNSIERQFDEIENEYARGLIKTCKIEEKALQDRLARLERAKRHLAYLISERIKKLNEKLNNVPEDELAKTENELSIFRSKQDAYSQLEEEYKTALEKSKDHDWLESALSYYKELISKTVKEPGKLPLVLFGIFAASGLVMAALIIFRYKSISTFSIVLYAGIICFCLLAVVVFSLINVKKITDFTRQTGKNEELDKIKKEFKKRTGMELTDISLLESTLNRQRESTSRSALLENQISSLNKELKERHFLIKRKTESFYTGKIDEADWEELIRQLKQNNKNINSQIDSEKEELYKLDVPVEEYISEDTGIKYSQEEYEKVKSALEDKRNEIKNTEDMIQNLKYRICDKTKDDPGIEWEELIENLRRKRQEAQDLLKEISASIIAGLTVHRVVSGLREEEDLKIKEGLQSETVIKPLKDITQRYTGLDIDNGNLIISDPYDNFSIRDLSTGAREQVMLALRIGFTRKLLKKDSLFLILDDAFQHSDWEKREILIEKLADIAKNGWQIVYMTMDDHIKGLFERTGKKFKKGRYKSFEL
jgi:DNA repair exonuclease SbcCD ATPase subunit